MNRVDLKVVFLGSEFVGKSSLLQRLIHDRFSENSYQNTIGAAFAAKQMESKSKKIMIGVWDTAGSERYEAMSRMYYRGAKAAVVCYDICNPSSWDRAKFWINELRRHEENCLVYLCGTKMDTAEKRNVPKNTAEQYAKNIQVSYFETSSKTGENVAQLFQQICDDFANNPDNLQQVHQSFTLSVTKEKSNCCLAKVE